MDTATLILVIEAWYDCLLGSEIEKVLLLLMFSGISSFSICWLVEIVAKIISAAALNSVGTVDRQYEKHQNLSKKTKISIYTWFCWFGLQHVSATHC